MTRRSSFTSGTAGPTRGDRFPPIAASELLFFYWYLNCQRLVTVCETNCLSCSEMCGSMDNLDLGDTVEYTLSKGKGNKVSAEKVTRVPYGMECLFKPYQASLK